ncbi:MAG: VWA domain-containing protein [Luminiphilus sp.]|nr:VWA domain-containing protein [Luminiphilus sp.]
MIELAYPELFLLAPLPIVMRFLRAGNRSEEAALEAPFANRWRQLAKTSSLGFQSSPLKLIVLILIWLSLVTAATRPQWVGEPIELANSGRDLLLAIDLSGSMQIEDMQIGNSLVSRITAVKAIAADFASRRTGDRVGLILFGTRAYVQAPLTFDVKTVKQFIEEAQLGFAGEDTAIGDALGLAVKRLRERPANSRVLILLTDGQDTASTVDPMEAAALASEMNVRIYTIGISRRLGTSSNASGEVDEALLTAIAQATGGRYFRARTPQELQGVYQVLDELEPVEQEKSTFRPIESMTWVPASVAFWLALLLIVLRTWPQRRLRSAPKEQQYD